MAGPNMNAGPRSGRMAWLRLMAHFAVTRGRSPVDAFRLFYHTSFKPSLAYRGWHRNDPSRILSFSGRGPNGKKLTVHARDNGRDVGTFEEFFSARYQIIPPETPPRDLKVVYDIGANIGIASMYFGCWYPNARFLAFEPVPDNFEVCQHNFKNLPAGSEVFPWAVGEKSQVCTFDFDEADLRGGSIGSVTGKVASAATKRKKIEVQVYSVHDLVTQKKLSPPDFVKIDVEGAEMDVLKGLGEQGRVIKRMLIETHSEQLMIDCMKWVLDHGFLIWHVHSLPGGFSSIWCDRKS